MGLGSDVLEFFPHETQVMFCTSVGHTSENFSAPIDESFSSTFLFVHLCNANKAEVSLFLLTRPIFVSELSDKVSQGILVIYLCFAPFFLCNLGFILL